jgi:hypothetical protein
MRREREKGESLGSYIKDSPENVPLLSGYYFPIKTPVEKLAPGKEVINKKIIPGNNLAQPE